jgi:hypothetical protein
VLSYLPGQGWRHWCCLICHNGLQHESVKGSNCAHTPPQHKQVCHASGQLKTSQAALSKRNTCNIREASPDKSAQQKRRPHK